MRLAVPTLMLLALSVPLMAQDRGSFVIDAMTTPGRHLGLGYYLTDGLSVRPSLGIGYSELYGTTFDLGVDLRWEMMPGHRVSPYATGSINYFREPYMVPVDASGSPLTNASQDMTRYGAGLGVRARLKYNISLVAEGLVMNAALRELPGPSGLQTLESGAHFEGAVGVSYAFN
jgi:outer membrane protein with beta-barrel domain